MTQLTLMFRARVAKAVMLWARSAVQAYVQRNVQLMNEMLGWAAAPLAPEYAYVKVTFGGRSTRSHANMARVN